MRKVHSTATRLLYRFTAAAFWRCRRQSGTPAATASVTIGSLGLAGDQAKDGIPQEATLHLSARLEDALTGYLKNGSSPAGGSLFSGGRGVALLLLLVAGAGLVAWAVRKRPVVAAPLGAVGLAAAVIKNPEHLSRLGWGGFVTILILFSVVTAVLLFLCGLQFWSHLTPRDEEGEERDGKRRLEKKVSRVSTQHSIFSRGADMGSDHSVLPRRARSRATKAAYRCRTRYINA